MATLTAEQTQTSGSIDASATRKWIALACVALWPAAGLLRLNSFSWLDTLNLAGLCAATLIGLLVMGGRAASAPLGRVWTVLTYLAAVMLLSPPFARGTLFDLNNPAMFAAVCAAALFAILLWAVTPTPRRKAADLLPDDEPLPAGKALEEFARSPRVRLHLLFMGGFLLAACAQLSGQSLSSAAPEFGVLALALLAGRPLLQLAARPAFARTMALSAAMVLAAGAFAGGARYMQAQGLVDDMHSLLKGNKVPEAETVSKSADALNENLKSTGLSLRLRTEWAEFHEGRGDYPNAGEQWGKVADLRQIPRQEFLPSQRVLWKLGDSVSAWRRLVYLGFPAIKQPEVAQGVLELGDRPNADVRARLLAALLACELQNPPDDCRRRLEAVQAVAPHEVSSHILLERMGAAAYERTLVLPADLLIGHEPRFNAVTGTVDSGTIEEQGELRTVLVLGKGHYEMVLTARATTLLDQWPIIRVELDGQEIGRTQVVHSEDHGIPFTFDVNATNAFVLRIVFENYVDALTQGKVQRRGLGISAISFQRAKE